MERMAEPGNGNEDDLDRIERCASPLSMDVERGKLKLQLLKVPLIDYVRTFLGFLNPPPYAHSTVCFRDFFCQILTFGGSSLNQ